jgi:hypothetical protein
MFNKYKMERFIIRKTTRNIKLKKDMETKIINKMEDTEDVEDVVDIKDIELDIEEYVNEEDEKEPIIVYTDGACSNNGRSNARAGFGVYFGKDDPRNVSEAYKGPQTNNVAELLAIIKALSILRQEIDNGEKLLFILIQNILFGVVQIMERNVKRKIGKKRNLKIYRMLK